VTFLHKVAYTNLASPAYMNKLVVQAELTLNYLCLKAEDSSFIEVACAKHSPEA
jgi:hypothetical protein